MKLEVGDKVVYPNQGVGVIEDVVVKKIGGTEDQYYLLSLEATHSTVMIPCGNINSVGLRRLSGKKYLEELLKILKREEKEPDTDWKVRYKRNVERMNSGTLTEAGQVLKSLYQLSRKKSLGLRDRKMMEGAHQVVVSEVAAIKNLSTEDATELVNSLLGIEDSPPTS